MRKKGFATGAQRHRVEGEMGVVESEDFDELGVSVSSR
jgi:hypothetical protein